MNLRAGVIPRPYFAFSESLCKGAGIMADSDNATLTETHVEAMIPGMWKCIIHNDDFTPMEFVVAILQRVFSLSNERAETVMQAAHENGKAAVGLYFKEIAITKAQQAVSLAHDHGHPLLVTAEPA